ncbi:undecaprenyl-diphosphate phosphatase, partial [Bacteroides uniformis]|uniref:undecaprenyl-diphosphate phosphatase n=1 Tax=Bacteroides uniformis TaxID=820 RepID=UPI00293F6E3E
KVLVGCLPAAVLGLMFDDFLDEHFHKFLPIALMLIIYGVLFIIVENLNKDREPSITSFQDFTYKAALIIGFFQVL